jgi:hypothetical protein
MTITKFDRSNLAILQADIEAALKAVGEKHGVKIGAGSGKFSATNFSLKVECFVAGAGTGDDDASVRLDKFAEAFKRYQPLYFSDLTMEAVYQIGTAKYKIVGYNSRAREYPFLLKDQASGKVFKFPEDRVKAAKVIS